jgi:hypothetical protein
MQSLGIVLVFSNIHFLRLHESSDFLDRPDMIGNPSFHSWRHAQDLVNSREIIVHLVERQRCHVVLNLLAEPIRVKQIMKLPLRGCIIKILAVVILSC